MPDMPEFVENFAWATGWDVELLCYSGPGVAWRAPNLESPEWRQAVMDGLIDQDYLLTFGEFPEPGTKEVVISPPKHVRGEDDFVGRSTTSVNAALNAACTQARKAQNA